MDTPDSQVKQVRECPCVTLSQLELGASESPSLVP